MDIITKKRIWELIMNLLYLFLATYLSIVDKSSCIQSFVLKQQINDCHVCRQRIPLTPRNVVQLSSPTVMYISKNSKSNCCVIASLLFPFVTQEISERLSLPLITIDDLHDSENKMIAFSHAIVLEPYIFDINRVQSYAIGIVQIPRNDPSTTRKKNNSKGNKSIISMKPLYIDFMPLSNSKLGRRTIGETGPDLLIKAIRPKRNNKNDFLNETNSSQQSPIVIYDLTAGFGQDALLIAHAIMNMNGRVHMVERNPIIVTLLNDAMRRLQLIAHKEQTIDTGSTNNPQNIAQQLLDCLSIEYNNGIDVLNKILQDSTLEISNNNTTSKSKVIEKPDIIYLDPMFPTRRKSASVKKNMQILHTLLTHDDDDDEDCDCDHRDDNHDDAIQPRTTATQRKELEESLLLQLSYQVAKHRVVVKRPIQVPAISFISSDNNTINKNRNTTRSTRTIIDIKPSYQIIGTINRWDVYNK